LVDRMDLGSIAERRWGSSPHTRTRRLGQNRYRAEKASVYAA
jgi:hypothetical protein